ncbi:ABC transporter substrate-binding protein [Azoarcus sp. KH32C]|uniref:ABC transporter substrate-binding protein n=1 Tax=Azoarcus sp. KH32C TaxID=748247 RepID=UPI0002385E1A|nr:ABC transporter substrate-binding protein [Azoarcus sp. KH32C]BAL27205.1 extracellular solute-binding protein family 1 [Azoarcus sp. KH32C]
MKTILRIALLVTAAASSVGCAQLQSGYPASYAKVVAAAKNEGKLVVYSVTSSVPMILQDFRSLYPEITLDYVVMDTGPLYERVIAESATGSTADVVWSSAMDLQVKLVADGYAAAYASPEAAKLPSWAVWRNEAYGTTFEPIGFVYNKTLMNASELPQSRAELAGLLTSQKDRFKDKLTAFDPEKSGLGYFMMTQDRDASPDAFWNVAQALGATGLYPGSGSGAQFERLSKAESLIGYNLLLSYATGRIKKDLPQLGVVLPRDHTLVTSRVMFISNKAAHPNAAKLWVDYLLSKRGQEMLAKSDLGSLRADVDDPMTPSELVKLLGDAVKPVVIGPGLLTNLEAAKRREFLARWKASVVAPTGK